MQPGIDMADSGSRVGGGREVAITPASVRLSNCTYGLPLCSFHEDSYLPLDAREGISLTRLTSPYSAYSNDSGNCRSPLLRHRLNRCDQMRGTTHRSRRWKRVRMWRFCSTHPNLARMDS